MAFQKRTENQNQCESWIFFFQKLVGQVFTKIERETKSCYSSASHRKLNDIKFFL